MCRDVITSVNYIKTIGKNNTVILINVCTGQRYEGVASYMSLIRMFLVTFLVINLDVCFHIA